MFAAVSPDRTLRQELPAKPVRVFIIAGQSNAEGHNHIRQYRQGKLPFPQELLSQPHVLFWHGDDTILPPSGAAGASGAAAAADSTGWGWVGTNRWTGLGVHTKGSFGPEIAFGRDMAAASPGVRIALIKYASGGTGIARSRDYTDYIPALKGFDDRGRHWHPPTDGGPPGNLYRGLISNVRAAMDGLRRGEGGDVTAGVELVGMLWMQGEHEAGISLRMAEDYETLLAGFVSAVRSDIGVEALPMAVGQVNSHTWVYGDIARKGQAAFCRKDARSRLVHTMDLPRVDGDASHFTADGMLTLGSRFATAMQDLLGASATPR